MYHQKTKKHMTKKNHAVKTLPEIHKLKKLNKELTGEDCFNFHVKILKKTLTLLFGILIFSFPVGISYA